MTKQTNVWMNMSRYPPENEYSLLNSIYACALYINVCLAARGLLPLLKTWAVEGTILHRKLILSNGNGISCLRAKYLKALSSWFVVEWTWRHILQDECSSLKIFILHNHKIQKSKHYMELSLKLYCNINLLTEIIYN